MKQTTKAWLWTAVSLILVGLTVFSGVMTMLHWDFSKLSTVNYETNRHEIREEFDNISVITDTADIRLALSEDGICRVDCYEDEKAIHTVTVRDGTLVIDVINSKRWYEYIGIDLGGSPTITVYLPNAEYASLLIRGATGNVEVPEKFTFGDVDVSTRTGDIDCYASVNGTMILQGRTGDIDIANLSVVSLSLSVSTGKVTAAEIRCEGDLTVGITTGKINLSGISCQSLTATGRTGGIALTDVIAAERFSIGTGTGDITLTGCDAAELSLETGTGDITGCLLSDKIFITEVSTGSVDVPKTTTGGLCRITIRTGDVRLSIQ